MVGLLGWTSLQLYTNLTAPPSLTLKRTGGRIVWDTDTTLTSEVTFILTNHSSIKFQNLRLIVFFNNLADDGTPLPDPKTIYSPEIIPLSPAALIDSPPVESPDKKSVTFFIPVMQPGNIILLKFRTHRHWLVDKYPGVAFTCDQPVRLEDYNFHTLIYENRVLLDLFLLIFSLTAVGVYLLLKSD
jgi:hypothetical protein